VLKWDKENGQFVSLRRIAPIFATMKLSSNKDVFRLLTKENVESTK